MEQNLNKDTEIKDKINSFLKKNKFKFFSLILISLICLATYFILEENKKRKNIFLSERYIKAGLLLTEGKNEDAKNLFEEIIYSKNKFYSLLALNNILENKLISNEEQIIKYFSELENLNYPEDMRDLIFLKKALFLSKEDKTEESKKILEKLQEKNSKLDIIVKEIINN